MSLSVCSILAMLGPHPNIDLECLVYNIQGRACVYEHVCNYPVLLQCSISTYLHTKRVRINIVTCS